MGTGPAHPDPRRGMRTPLEGAVLGLHRHQDALRGTRTLRRAPSSRARRRLVSTLAESLDEALWRTHQPNDYAPPIVIAAMFKPDGEPMGNLRAQVYEYEVDDRERRRCAVPSNSPGRLRPTRSLLLGCRLSSRTTSSPSPHASADTRSPSSAAQWSVGWANSDSVPVVQALQQRPERVREMPAGLGLSGKGFSSGKCGGHP